MATELEKLLERIRNKEFDEKAMCDLPTFGGSEPEDTMGVWSWDETHMIVGESDFEIVKRCACGENPASCKHYKIGFKIIRDLGAEWGESPQLFSDDFDLSEFIDSGKKSNPDWDWDEYPEPDDAEFSETIEWLRDINSNFILRNACISDEEMSEIKKIL